MILSRNGSGIEIIQPQACDLGLAKEPQTATHRDQKDSLDSRPGSSKGLSAKLKVKSLADSRPGVSRHPPSRALLSAPPRTPQPCG